MINEKTRFYASIGVDCRHDMTIKLLVPSVPPIEAALPYIKRAEELRMYSNFGVNVQELERRLSEYFSGPYVVTCANCTVGLELVYTLKLLRGARKIELPALTFPATWLAANRAGLGVIPIDVDRDTWVAPRSEERRVGKECRL